MDSGTDLGATVPVKKDQPTGKQIGEWRLHNFTVQRPIVTACGHKLDLTAFPSQANCFACWEAFFSAHPEGVGAVHDLLQQGGSKAVVAMYGKKFTKMYGRYLQKQIMCDLTEQQQNSQPQGLEVFDIAKETQNAETTNQDVSQ